MEFRLVPDDLRDREPVRRGRVPKTKLSRALLNGGTFFVPGKKRTWGSLYTLASNHGLKAHTKHTEINGEEGTLIWFEKTAITLGPPPPPDRD